MYRISLKMEEDGRECPSVSSPEEVVPVFRAEVPKDDPREHLLVILCDRKNKATGTYLAAIGGVSNVPFDRKVIAAAAINSLASGVILVHNHPSGDPKPSGCDIKATNDVKAALNMLCVSLLDHVIIGDGIGFSFASDGYFQL